MTTVGKCGSHQIFIFILVLYLINIKEEKLDEYKEKSKELQANFKYRFENLKSLKSTFAFFEIKLSEKATGELELLEIKEDQALQILVTSSSMIEFRKRVPESTYPKLKKAG